MNKISAAIGLAFKQALPQSVDAGAQFVFFILSDWSEGFGLGGGSYILRNGEAVLCSGDLPWSEADDGSIVFAIDAPEVVDGHRLMFIVFAENERQERAEGTLIFALKTLPHETSLAVWDNPSPM